MLIKLTDFKKHLIMSDPIKYFYWVCRRSESADSDNLFLKMCTWSDLLSLYRCTPGKLDMADASWPGKYSHRRGLWQGAPQGGGGPPCEVPLMVKRRECLRRLGQERAGQRLNVLAHIMRGRQGEAGWPEGDAQGVNPWNVLVGFSQGRTHGPVRWTNGEYFRFNGNHFKDLLTSYIYLSHQQLFCAQDTRIDTGATKKYA